MAITRVDGKYEGILIHNEYQMQLCFTRSGIYVTGNDEMLKATMEGIGAKSISSGKYKFKRDNDTALRYFAKIFVEEFVSILVRYCPDYEEEKIIKVSNTGGMALKRLRLLRERVDKLQEKYNIAANEAQGKPTNKMLQRRVEAFRETLNLAKEECAHREVDLDSPNADKVEFNTMCKQVIDYALKTDEPILKAEDFDKDKQKNRIVIAGTVEETVKQVNSALGANPDLKVKVVYVLYDE